MYRMAEQPMRSYNLVVGKGVLKGPNGLIPRPHPKTVDALHVASGGIISLYGVLTELFRRGTLSEPGGISWASTTTGCTDCPSAEGTNRKLSGRCILAGFIFLFDTCICLVSHHVACTSR